MGDAKAGLTIHSLGVKLRKKGSMIKAGGLCVCRFRDEKGRAIECSRLKAAIGENEEAAKLNFAMKYGLPLGKGIYLNRYNICFSIDALSDFDIQNKIFIRFNELETRLVYNIFDRKKGRFRTSRVVGENGIVCYMKQSVLNATYLTVREPQPYDTFGGKLKAEAAWILSKIIRKKDIIFLFEKECSKYEESGSVLYEKMIESGIDRAYFILNSDNPALQTMDPKYRKNIIYKDSFKHLLYFFMSRTFIGSESMSHAMQLRASNRHIVVKTRSMDIKYIFLQHGVMYMVSLNAQLRSAFRQTGLDLYRVVVSSQLEAQHFMDLGGFNREELYVTGLSKFDRSCRNDDADKIVIMPTWRRWESNQARQNFTETKYYKMIKRMVDAVPDNLKEKIIILPHPLMQQAMNSSQNELSTYLATESHDLTLQKCNLLITDYSSIAYDAFYRGSNVIFYWEEKEECMKKYGEEARLMINDDTAFGNVCYDCEKLAISIGNMYAAEQKQEHLEKYRKIVSFHDGRNSERIIELLKKDKVL